MNYETMIWEQGGSRKHAMDIGFIQDMGQGMYKLLSHTDSYSEQREIEAILTSTGYIARFRG